MSNLIIAELNNAEIRKTNDNRFSVFDLIRVAGGQKNPREVWKRMQETYSEVLTKCDNFKFEGKGQRETPVATVENCFYILGLLPGACGKSYREAAANLVRRYLEGDAELGVELIKRDTKEKQKHAMRRLNVVETNKAAADAVYQTNTPISTLHNDRYRGLYSKNTGQLREECDAKVNETPLNYMSERDLAYNYAVNLMVIESGDPSKAYEGGVGMAELHERVIGKKLTPEWTGSCLSPSIARKELES
jgi:hypothetical protein